MKVVCMGSLNIDRVYSVKDFVQEGSTISAEDYSEFAGGKGMNQSVALGRAGADVYHLGCVGKDGLWLKELLNQANVNTAGLKETDVGTGHAVIQINQKGQNCIIVVGGANKTLTEEQVAAFLDQFGEGDLLLMQNETSAIAFAMRYAHARGMKVAFNPSPITQELMTYPLKWVDYLILNEKEGAILSELPDQTEPRQLLDTLSDKYPQAAVILTLGDNGVIAKLYGQTYTHCAYRVPVVDTTGAGDTFCGYFLAALAKGESVDKALEIASRAGALAVTKNGAVPGIPTWEEVISSPVLGAL